MKSDYFIDFIYYDEALRQQERYKFLIEKYKENISAIKDLKIELVKEVDNFISLLDVLENEVKEFRKLLPTESVIEDIGEGKTKQVVKVPVKAKPKPVKKRVKKSVKDIKELRLGLQKIRDELARM